MMLFYSQQQDYRMLLGERTMSSVKKKGGSSRGQFTRMHLGVYPTELEFFSPVDFKTAFYFQKNYQLLGQIQEIIPASSKNSKLSLSNINNLIYFQLYDPNNIVYKWSLYRKTDNSEEEHIDSCSLNLKEAVNSYLAPLKNHIQHSANSIIELGFIQKQMRLKFPKINVVLTFILFVAQDQQMMRQYVQRKLINKEQDGVIENTFIKTDSNSMNQGIGLVSRRNVSGVSGIGRKSSDPLGELTFSNTNKPSEQLSRQHQTQDKKEDVIKKSTNENLENLIFSFDASGTLAQAVNAKLENLKINSNDNDDDSELVFHEERYSSRQEPPQKNQNNYLEAEKTKKEEKQIEKRDYSMLKLDSDQGRVRMDPIDKKLQELQLEAIEQEKPSRECTISMHPLENVNPLKNRANRMRGEKIPSLHQIEQLQTELKQPQSNLKKVLFIFIFSILLFVGAAVMLQGKKKGKKGKGRG